MGLRNSVFRRQRFPLLSEDQLRQIAAIPRGEMRHTRLVQHWLAEGRAEGEAAVTLRLLHRRCEPLNPNTTGRMQALPLEQWAAQA